MDPWSLPLQHLTISVSGVVLLLTVVVVVLTYALLHSPYASLVKYSLTSFRRRHRRRRRRRRRPLCPTP